MENQTPHTPSSYIQMGDVAKFINNIERCMLPGRPIILFNFGYSKVHPRVHCSLNWPLVLAFPFRQATLLQPKNNSPSYKFLLFFQAFAVLGAPNTIRRIDDPSPAGFARAFVRIFAGLLMLRIGFSFRWRATRLSRKRLSRFLTDTVFIPVLTLFTVSAFFSVDPIREMRSFEALFAIRFAHCSLHPHYPCLVLHIFLFYTL